MSKTATGKTKIKERIESLEHQSELLKRELEGELEETKQNILNFGKIALGITGGLILGKIVVSGLLGRRKDKKKNYKASRPRVYHRFKDQLLKEASHQALLFLLEIARAKMTTAKKDLNADNTGSDLAEREKEA